jgi:hypothetical protein
MTKQETIQHLTDLMGVISNAYWKGRLGVRNGDDTGGDGACCGELWVHETYLDGHSAAISIDLYHFGGDGKDVCDGLHDCTVTFDDGTTAKGRLFCMAYNPDDEVTPLVFEFTLGDDDDTDRPCDIDVDPEGMPEEVLRNVTAWLEGVFQRMPVMVNTNLTN